jgi:hypothetical protein
MKNMYTAESELIIRRPTAQALQIISSLPYVKVIEFICYYEEYAYEYLLTSIYVKS